MKRIFFLVMILVFAGLFCGAFQDAHGNPPERVVLQKALPVNAVTKLLYGLRLPNTLMTVGCLFASACSIGALFRDGGRGR